MVTGRQKFRKTLHSLAILLVLLCVVAPARARQGQQMSPPQQPGQQTLERTLYQRLGGYDAIAAAVDDFVGRLVGDRRFARFFAGFSNDSKRRIRQHIIDQLCAAAGGPCVYTGRSMRTSHEGLGITEEDWNAAARHLVASLDRFHVPQREKDEVLAIVNTLKSEIVEGNRR